MLSVKDSTLAPNFDQSEDQIYHLSQMAYHLKNLKRCLEEARIDLDKYLYHAKEIKDDTVIL